MLARENTEQITWFLDEAGGRDLGFERLCWREQWQRTIGDDPPRSAAIDGEGLLLTPARHGTDGFFIALLHRSLAPAHGNGA